jgi:hypothetical protein
MEIPLKGFFGKEKAAVAGAGGDHGQGSVHDHHEHDRPPAVLRWSMAAIVTTSVACVVLFVYPEPFHRLMSMVTGP